MLLAISQAVDTSMHPEPLETIEVSWESALYCVTVRLRNPPTPTHSFQEQQTTATSGYTVDGVDGADGVDSADGADGAKRAGSATAAKKRST